MKLLRLLTAGKSLVGLKNSESRYRFSRQHLLPKFPMRENPFRATVMPEAGCMCASTTAIPAEESPREASQSVPQTDPTTAQPAESLARKWVSRLRALRGQRNPAGARGTASAAGGSGPVQIELSLDSVKVLRNDLSDTDFEVVPAAGGPGLAAGRASRCSPGRGKPEATADLALATTTWNRVAGRFLGAGRS